MRGNRVEANTFFLEDDFTCEELNESLLKLKNNKSAGPDKIPTKMIKKQPPEIVKNNFDVD